MIKGGIHVTFVPVGTWFLSLQISVKSKISGVPRIVWAFIQLARKDHAQSQIVFSDVFSNLNIPMHNHTKDLFLLMIQVL